MENERYLFLSLWRSISKGKKIHFPSSNKLLEPEWYSKYVTEVRLKKGEALITEGDMGVSFFVILKGWVSIRFQKYGGRDVHRLFAGEVFGQRAQTARIRSASVIAGCTPCLAFEISYKALDNALLVDHREIIENETLKKRKESEEEEQKKRSLNFICGVSWRELHPSMNVSEIYELEDKISKIPELYELQTNQVRRLIQLTKKMKNMEKKKNRKSPSNKKSVKLQTLPSEWSPSLIAQLEAKKLRKNKNKKQKSDVAVGNFVGASLAAKRAFLNLKNKKVQPKSKQKKELQMECANEYTPYLYIVDNSTFNVFDNYGKKISENIALNIIGYESVRYQIPARNTIELSERCLNCEIYRISREHFHQAMDKSMTCDSTQILTVLQNIPLFNYLSNAELKILAKDHCINELYLEGETVLEKGQYLEHLYIVKNGEIGKSDLKLSDTVQSVMNRYSYFGIKSVSSETIKVSRSTYKALQFAEVIRIPVQKLWSYAECELLDFRISVPFLAAIGNANSTFSRTNTNTNTITLQSRISTANVEATVDSFDTESEFSHYSWVYDMTSLDCMIEGQIIEHFADGHSKICEIFNQKVDNWKKLRSRTLPITHENVSMYNDKVERCQKQNKFVVCLKRISKVVGSLKQCIREVQAMEALRFSAFVPEIYAIFNRDEDICIIMDICMGGSLEMLRERMFHSSRKLKCLKESNIHHILKNRMCKKELRSQTNVHHSMIPLPIHLHSNFIELDTENIFNNIESIKFYAGNIALALDDFHTEGYLYRNLCLRNVRISSDGYPKLYNLQHSICMNSSSKISLCAGHNFDRSSAEVIVSNFNRKKSKRKSDSEVKLNVVTPSVDWWMFGIILVELCTGFNPFYKLKKYESWKSDNILNEIRLRIKKCVHELKKDSNVCTKSALHLIRCCLKVNPESRILNIQQIKDHSFFHGFHWRNRVKNCECCNPPFVPQLLHARDTKYLDKVQQNNSIFQVTQELWPKNAHAWERQFSEKFENILK